MRLKLNHRNSMTMYRYMLLLILSLLYFANSISAYSETVTTSYDNLYRVLRIESDDGSMLITYTYDSAGNRLTMNSQGLVINMNVIDEGDYTLDNSSLNVNLTFYGDQYGNLTYMYALGTSCQGTDIQDWGVLDVDPDGSVALSGLTLPYYAPVFISVYVLNYAGDDVTGIVCNDGITVLNALEDTDNDGLTNEEELGIGTDPLMTDTDGDGYDDGIEIKIGSDPLDPDSIPDPVADAGPDQNAVTGTVVTLDGSNSYDLESDLLTFLWSFISARSEEHTSELQSH